jgi:hypothetical protein
VVAFFQEKEALALFRVTKSRMRELGSRKSRQKSEKRKKCARSGFFFNDFLYERKKMVFGAKAPLTVATSWLSDGQKRRTTKPFETILFRTSELSFLGTYSGSSIFFVAEALTGNCVVLAHLTILTENKSNGFLDKEHMPSMYVRVGFG